MRGNVFQRVNVFRSTKTGRNRGINPRVGDNVVNPNPFSKSFLINYPPCNPINPNNRNGVTGSAGKFAVEPVVASENAIVPSQTETNKQSEVAWRIWDRAWDRAETGALVGLLGMPVYGCFLMMVHSFWAPIDKLNSLIGQSASHLLKHLYFLGEFAYVTLPIVVGAIIGAVAGAISAKSEALQKLQGAETSN
jgi:hypothetical protein